MLPTLAALLVGVAIGLGTGGRLRYAARRRISWWGLILAGLALQVAADRWLSGWVGYLAMVAGPLCLLVWAARNARLTGIGVVAVGIAANLVVIGIDRGMPVSGTALVRAGIAAPGAVIVSVAGHRHHLERRSDHLRFLDDRIPIGATHQILSIGDLILAVGLVDMVVHLLWYQPRFQRIRPRPRWMASEWRGRLIRSLDRDPDG